VANLNPQLLVVIVIFCGHFPDALGVSLARVQTRPGEWYLRQMLGRLLPRRACDAFMSGTFAPGSNTSVPDSEQSVRRNQRPAGDVREYDCVHLRIPCGANTLSRLEDPQARATLQTPQAPQRRARDELRAKFRVRDGVRERFLCRPGHPVAHGGCAPRCATPGRSHVPPRSRLGGWRSAVQLPVNPPSIGTRSRPRGLFSHAAVNATRELHRAVHDIGPPACPFRYCVLAPRRSVISRRAVAHQIMDTVFERARPFFDSRRNVSHVRRGGTNRGDRRAIGCTQAR